MKEENNSTTVRIVEWSLKNEGLVPTLSNKVGQKERDWNRLWSNDQLKSKVLKPTLSNDRLKNEGLETVLSTAC
jgi:hypothetical protein